MYLVSIIIVVITVINSCIIPKLTLLKTHFDISAGYDAVVKSYSGPATYFGETQEKWRMFPAVVRDVPE